MHVIWFSLRTLFARPADMQRHTSMRFPYRAWGTRAAGTVVFAFLTSCQADAASQNEDLNHIVPLVEHVRSDSSDGLTFESPAALMAGPRGQLFLPDAVSGVVHVVSAATGERLGSWGRKGSGPGEYGQWGSFQLVGDTSVLVADVTNRKLIRFSLDGIVQSERSMPNISFRQIVEGRNAQLHAQVRADSAQSKLLRSINAALLDSTPAHYLSVEWYDDPDERDYRNRYRLRASDDGGVWAANRFSGRIYRFSSDGVETRSLTIPISTGQDTVGAIITRAATDRDMFQVRRLPAIDDIVPLSDGSLIVSSLWRPSARDHRSRILLMRPDGKVTELSDLPFRVDVMDRRSDTLFFLTREGTSPAAVRLYRLAR